MVEKCNQKRVLEDLYYSYVSSALPENCLDHFSPIQPQGKTLLVGVGKAAIEYCKVLQHKIQGNYTGIIISTYDKIAPGGDLEKFDVFSASHPLPDKNGLFASRHLMKEVASLTSNDLLLFLISGGGSALLPAPPHGFTLDDEIILNQSLLDCGAPIQIMNLVRKHFSRLKGGRLARLAFPAKVHTLVVSDIPDDDIAQVASGPTLATSGTAQDAIRAIRENKIVLPKNIQKFFLSDKIDTPNPEDGYFKDNIQELLVSAIKCMESTVTVARSMGLKVVVISDRSQGESKKVAGEHVKFVQDFLLKNLVLSGQRVLFISGGETSVAVANPEGKGGRNGEYLLSLAIHMESANVGPFVAIAADTDGIDGTEKNAGAIIDQNTIRKIKEKNLCPKELLDKNNSYLAFEAAGELFFTGPTGTNVNDFRAIMININ